MIIEWKGIALILALVFAMLIIIKLFDKKYKLNGELKRKLFHSSMGLAMLLFPHMSRHLHNVWKS